METRHPTRDGWYSRARTRGAAGLTSEGQESDFHRFDSVKFRLTVLEGWGLVSRFNSELLVIALYFRGNRHGQPEWTFFGVSLTIC